MMFAGLLNPAWVDRASDLQVRFRDAQPFPHIVIDDFLDPTFCRELIAEFPPFGSEAVFSEHGTAGGKRAINDVCGIGPTYRRFDELMRSEEFLRLVGEVTGVPRLLYDPDYVGGGTHENRNGQGLDAHVDFNYHPKTGLHRRLNLILFLNPEWQESWGGALQLYRDPWTSYDDESSTAVQPLVNRCVIFATSEVSWHGFRAVSIPSDAQERGVSRRSLAVYFYTAERPAEEVAPEHATIYVPPPLPDCVAAGHTLTQDEVNATRELVSRRDHQLKFLYERERKREIELASQVRQLSQYVDDIRRSPSYKIARALTWPLRAIQKRLG